MRLSEIVKSYRRLHSLSQEELGNRCGLTKAYISMIENEKNSKNKKKITPRIDSLAKLAQGMGMELDELVRSIDKDMVVSLMPTTPILTDEELQLIADFRKLNREGQNAALGVVHAYTLMESYIKKEKSAVGSF